MSERAVLRRVLTHLLLPLLMCIGMGLAYESAFHAPSPHHMKVAVVGSGPQADVLAQTLKDKAGDALDVTTLPSADAARAQIMDRTLVAAYTPSATAPSLMVATANSATDVEVAQKIFTQVAGLQHEPLAVDNLTPMPPQDPTNQALFFLLVAISIGSYGSVAVIGGAGEALRMRTRAALCLGVSFTVAAIGAALAGPVFHFVHHDLLGVFGLAWVYSFAVVAIGTALHRFLGRWTTLGTMLLFVMLNFTSSGGVFRPDLQNGFFASLHSFWIGSGFVEGGRSLVYFDGRAGFATDVWILAAWAAVGAAALALTAVFEHKRRPLPLLAMESEADAAEEREEATVAA
ncbi:membrane protein [Streptacidiphilus neutrinimicus]|uniref:membrane protein n=1 Tax=Streptacidiphilus neutrinimicus TaxID=105420 RepID=UPI0005A68628|nr:membrane protein [Streptacidiphilus neutrinimicus]